jgi:hypothetical protein
VSRRLTEPLGPPGTFGIKSVRRSAVDGLPHARLAGTSTLAGHQILRGRDPQPAVVTRPGCLSAGRAALWSTRRGCRANDPVTDAHFRRAVRRLGVFDAQTDQAAPLGDLREAGFRTIRSGQPFAFAERLRRSANDRGRTPLADRRRLRGTTMSVLNRLWNVYKHRRLPLLPATLAREGGR